MPGMATSLLALLDDITSVLDDVAVLSKLAASKTAGVVGDDLALNAQQLTGVRAERELPVVWAVAKGSFINKVILVPSALAISALAPWAVTPLLMIGGAYLCFEGVEKIAHRWLHAAAEDRAAHDALTAAVADDAVDLVAFEREKIRGAVRTDFILSAEIITITLGTVAASSLGVQFAVIAGIALLMTVGVYGLVAAIVKIDDLGLHLSRQSSALSQRVGRAIVRAAPWLMKALSVAGTAAMFLVGGGILVHGAAPLRQAVESFASTQSAWLAALLPLLADAAVGVAAGAVALAAVTIVQRLRGCESEPAKDQH